MYKVAAIVLAGVGKVYMVAEPIDLAAVGRVMVVVHSLLVVDRSLVAGIVVVNPGLEAAAFVSPSRTAL